MSVFANLFRPLFACLVGLWFSISMALAQDLPCATQGACAEEAALWSALKSNKTVKFRNAFEMLQKKNSSKLYSEIEKLSFANTTEETSRALMIAWVIAHERDNVPPTLSDFDYWKSWYERTDPASIERLIPTYMLFDFHDKASRRVSRYKNSISDSYRYLAYTLQDSTDRTGNLSVESLTENIRDTKINLASMTAILDPSTRFLTDDEGLTFKNYFRIFESLHEESALDLLYNLPFPETLNTAVQSPDLWGDKFRSFLKCRRDVEENALVRQLIKIKPQNPILKSCLKKRLKNTDDLVQLLKTLSLITNSDILRADSEIREAVESIKDNNPFTFVRVAKQFALASEVHERVWDHGAYEWGDPRDKVKQKLDESRAYCYPDVLLDIAYAENPPKLMPPLDAKIWNASVFFRALKTPSGYLAGHIRGGKSASSGLFYYADESSQPQRLIERPLLAIIESNESDIYWALSAGYSRGLREGFIHRIDAREDNVSVQFHKSMPIATYNLKLLENGDLFMDYWVRSDTYFENGKDVIKPNPSSDYNPPVILTRAGELIVSPCAKETA